MSLIVLNSKGSDPEDFSNFMTEQIKFPQDAEVCLVSSNVNRKIMVDSEASISAGCNSIGFQLGYGNLAANGTRGNTKYTPHSPFMIDIETAGKNFPITAVGTGVGGVINESFNNTNNIPISNIARGWASGAGIPTGGEPFTFWNTAVVVEEPSEGDVGDWINIVGANRINNSGGDINSVIQTGGTIEAQIGAYINWKKLSGVDGNGLFVDNEPLWNTHNGARLGTFPVNASNINVLHGGYNWRFETRLADTTRALGGLRGGIFDNSTFTNQNIYNVNSNINKQQGGTAYTIWWELSRIRADGACEVNFYARKPGSKADLGVNSRLDANVANWARARLPATPGGMVSLGIRPVEDNTAPNSVYVMEAYFGVTDLASNTYTLSPAPCVEGGLAGKIVISDPRNPDTYTGIVGGDRLNFDLYRHLPLRMGTTSTATEPEVFCNAIHHRTTIPAAMSAADLGAFSPYTFLLGDLAPSQQAEGNTLGGSWDAECRQILRKATLASVLGYNTHYGFVAATAMLPAQAGFPALIDLGLTRPEALSLVVTLPDLPITGYYGNSSGDGAAGTLNMNSGGNSAAIVGVIPFGNRPYKDAESGIAGSSDRGEFHACPMENWICLNNPAPFSVSSLRCRITDALGNKPQVLDSTSTITIKIKKRGSNVDFRQGGMNGVFTGY